MLWIQAKEATFDYETSLEGTPRLDNAWQKLTSHVSTSANKIDDSCRMVGGDKLVMEENVEALELLKGK